MWLCYHQASLSQWFYDNDALHNVADLWALVDNNDPPAAIRHCSYGQRLTTLLLRTQYRQCTDPRDRVFGILSLVNKEDEYSPETLLEVDYRKPCLEVMRDATRYAIQEMTSLRILEEAGCCNTN